MHRHADFQSPVFVRLIELTQGCAVTTHEQSEKKDIGQNQLVIRSPPHLSVMDGARAENYRQQFRLR
ncbi:MAG: hypothetical protein ACI8W7_000091 [Gammaproteobacteria bacterium]|jgi:hypothetical protein